MTLACAYEHWISMTLPPQTDPVNGYDIESVLRYCACNRTDACRMNIDDLMQSAIGNPQSAIMVPIIPVQDSTPPFPVESPLQYFLAWFRNLARWRPRRPSG